MQSLIDTGQPNARIFPDWSGKIAFSPDDRNYFPKPGIYQNHALAVLGLYVVEF